MVRVVSCVWASADIEALDINATVAAAMIADLGPGAVIETSCEGEWLVTKGIFLTPPSHAVLFRFALLCRFVLVNPDRLWPLATFGSARSRNSPPLRPEGAWRGMVANAAYGAPSRREWTRLPPESSTVPS
jgi:hypothetical protein